MEKSKLIEARTLKGLTQQQVADKLFMDVSNYNRREKGLIKITNIEWEKLSKILETPVEEIYETEENNFFVFKDQSTGNYLGTNHIYSIPEYIMEVQKKYIHKIENDNKLLEEENKVLREENQSLKDNLKTN